MVAGTPCYMAPEQADTRLAPLGRATDVYSLGVILYQMLTGRVPLEGEASYDTIVMVREQEPPPPRRPRPRDGASR